ncbi:MAG: hypothetical protein TREMPRED_002338 [Tremellales sp. Tagirdzhanova-0007]|nr:MAG: hypothetical protein TREMPRED_002338 [Tremellales sp. Tagirdzhanova-0007]
MSSSKAYDDMSKEEKSAHDAREKERERSEQSALPYSWTQDLGTLSISVPLPKGTRGKDCIVVLERKRLKVQLKSSPEPILSGELFNDISKDDSSWTVQDAIMTIELDKVSRRTYPLTSMVASRAHSSSEDRHYQNPARKLEAVGSRRRDPRDGREDDAGIKKFDNQQKAMGKPTSEEMKKVEMLDNFKKMHPEMDFSNAKMG